MRVLSQRFSAPYPASSPWVTAIGGTELAGLAEAVSSNSNPGVEVGSRLSTGGFSEIFPMPEYQKQAVEEFLSSGPAEYPQTFPGPAHYNAQGRAMPDISAQVSSC